MKRLLTSCICLGLVFTASAQSEPESDPAWSLPKAPTDAVDFSFKLKGYVFGLRVIKADYLGYYNDEVYAARADLRTSGLGALLKKLQIWAVTTGRVEGTNLRPITHVQQNLDKKSRRVEMNYDDLNKRVAVNIKPPLGSQGIPPATEDERYAAKDTVSAVLTMMLKGQSAKTPLCQGSIAVFDSKQHYNLRMVRDGERTVKFDGDPYDSIRCEVFYEPVSGFDPEDLPEAEEKNTPVVVYFTADPIHGLHVPMRFSYKVGMFSAVIKVSDMMITPPPPQ